MGKLLKKPSTSAFAGYAAARASASQVSNSKTKAQASYRTQTDNSIAIRAPHTRLSNAQSITVMSVGSADDHENKKPTSVFENNKAMLDSLTTVNTDAADFAITESYIGGETQPSRKPLPMQSSIGLKRMSSTHFKTSESDPTVSLVTKLGRMSANDVPVRIYLIVFFKGKDRMGDLISPCLVRGEQAPSLRQLWDTVRQRHGQVMSMSQKTMQTPTYFDFVVKDNERVSGKAFSASLYLSTSVEQIYSQFVEVCKAQGKEMVEFLVQKARLKRKHSKGQLKQAAYSVESTERVVPAVAEPLEAPVYGHIIARFD